MAPESTQKLSLFALTMMVVGGMVGAGIFSLPRTFAGATGPIGAIIAWLIAGTGMYMLARVFQSLAERKPDLDAGVFAYAKAGFGDYPGFLSAFGYWIGSCIGNVSYWVLIKSTLGAFFPVFGDGNTVVAIVGRLGRHLAVPFHDPARHAAGRRHQQHRHRGQDRADRGLHRAADLRLQARSVQRQPLRRRPHGKRVRAGARDDAGDRVRVPRHRGRERLFALCQGTSDVGRATILGFIVVTTLMVLVTLLPYAVMQRADIAGMRQPSMAQVLEAVVGHWGAVFVSVGLLISVLGAYLAWSLICAEVLFTAAKTEDMPKAFATENKNKVPVTALWVTNIVIQLIVITTYWSRDAFALMLNLTSAMALIPFLFVAAYGLKLTRRGETYDVRPHERQRDLIIAAIATIYTIFLLYAGGLKFIVLSAVLYAPGTALYFWARREQGKPVFIGASDWIIFILAVIGAVVGIYGLATGYITI